MKSLNLFINEELNQNTDFKDELSVLLQGLNDNSDFDGIAEFIIKGTEKNANRKLDQDELDKAKEIIVKHLKDMVPVFKEIKQLQENPSIKMLFKFPKLVKQQKKILNSLNDELTKIKNA